MSPAVAAVVKSVYCDDANDIDTKSQVDFSLSTLPASLIQNIAKYTLSGYNYMIQLSFWGRGPQPRDKPRDKLTIRLTLISTRHFAPST